MQCDHVLKKLNFDLLIPPPWAGEGVSAGKIFATMLLPFYFIYFDMQHDLALKKNEINDFFQVISCYE